MISAFKDTFGPKYTCVTRFTINESYSINSETSMDKSALNCCILNCNVSD